MKVERNTAELVYNETKNKFEVECTKKELPIPVVEVMLNQLYAAIGQGEAKEVFDIFMHELNKAKLISQLGWIFAIIMLLLFLLKGGV